MTLTIFTLDTARNLCATLSDVEPLVAIYSRDIASDGLWYFAMDICYWNEISCVATITVAI